eukprot:2403055-Pyramimonas_sp.AAC.1
MYHLILRDFILSSLIQSVKSVNPWPACSLTLPGLARRSDKPSAAPPGGGPKGVGGRRPRI